MTKTLEVQVVDSDRRESAKEWVLRNNNPYCFASNYWDKSQFLEFVEQLLTLGAIVEVGGIYDEPWRIKEEGGEYAETLFVTIPAQANPEIQALIESHGPDDMEITNNVIRVWWD